MGGGNFGAPKIIVNGGHFKMFRFATMKHHWGLLPVVGFSAAAGVLVTGYCIHMCVKKPDLSWTPWKYNTNPPYMNIEANEVRKFLNSHDLKPNVEVESLKREVAAEYKQ